MKIAAAKVKEMIASKRITFADQFPEIGARIYGQKERLNYGGDNPKPDPEYGTKLALSWELALWGIFVGQTKRELPPICNRWKHVTPCR